MKELSRQSLLKIRDLIHGQNYANIKARLDQKLPHVMSATFANIAIYGNDGVWYGDSDIDYRPYSEANAMEKEEIAAWLEVCKNEVCATLQPSMPYASTLFIIPSRDQIFWYHDSDGNVRVTLTQWGFSLKTRGVDVDVISMLISEPRQLTQADVSLHIDYSDGKPAANTDFNLLLFNGIKPCVTDEAGSFHVGHLFCNKTFAVEDASGGNHHDFEVKRDAEYRAVFEWRTCYTVAVENQKGERKPGFSFNIDGKPVVTNADGEYSAELVLTPARKLRVEAKDTVAEFALNRDAGQNSFLVKITDEEQKLEPPRPPKLEPKSEPGEIKVTLLDTDGFPLPDLPFSIISNRGMKIDAKTGNDGSASISRAGFSKKGKYKIVFNITPDYRENIEKIKRQANGNK